MTWKVWWTLVIVGLLLLVGMAIVNLLRGGRLTP